jgi:phage terminase small subunit
MHNEQELTPKQEIFCRNYAGTREFFGNGVQSYMDAFNCENYDTAKVEACNLLTNPNILKRINSILDLAGFNDENVDKQTAFLINQNVDYRAKIAAIKEYNQLKSRIKNKLEVNFGEEDRKSLKDIVDIMLKQEKENK